MALLDRDIYLRNHVLGVLVAYSCKGLSYSKLLELADSITEAVIEGDRNWQDQSCCNQLMEMTGNLDNDVPQ